MRGDAEADGTAVAIQVGSGEQDAVGGHGASFERLARLDGVVTRSAQAGHEHRCGRRPNKTAFRVEKRSDLEFVGHRPTGANFTPFDRSVHDYSISHRDQLMTDSS
ncbi:hypothetical protein GCM10022267_87850 [Lentzea roselyniae]|uniref:Uncharacterized protein n=1 Tax=Lentzea roselyniae TaxID=531940 RepID=A0ABP7CG80_9PSEU